MTLSGFALTAMDIAAHLLAFVPSRQTSRAYTTPQSMCRVTQDARLKRLIPVLFTRKSSHRESDHYRTKFNLVVPESQYMLGVPVTVRENPAAKTTSQTPYSLLEKTAPLHVCSSAVCDAQCVRDKAIKRGEVLLPSFLETIPWLKFIYVHSGYLKLARQ